MKFEPIYQCDLEEIKHLQPDDWNDIIPEIEFYIRSTFCFPVKVSMDNCIVGIGAAIIYDTTAWLAHIIVDRAYRNRGIGFQIVQELLRKNENTRIKTYLLTATELGKPVYTRAGFRPVAEYVFMNREKAIPEETSSTPIIPFEERYRHQVLQMDRRVSAENREFLISGAIHDAKLYTEGDDLSGFFIPGLGEGPVVADTVEAGLELMKIKCPSVNRVVLPADNLTGIEFLHQKGFFPTAIKGTRMILGKDLNWQPTKIYSRIGGNLG